MSARTSALPTQHTRRTILRGAAGAVAGAALVGSPAASSAAMPVNGPTVLTFMPAWSFWDSAGTGLLRQAVEEFEAAHRGLRVITKNGPNQVGNTAATILDMVAGRGPDVVADNTDSWPMYLSAGAFADLAPYLKQENIPLSTWSPGYIEALTADTGLMGLPTDGMTIIFAYRQDILDGLGLRYPDPDWTADEAVRLWTASTGTLANSHTHRFGAGLAWGWYGFTGNRSLIQAFGGRVIDASHTRCLIDSPLCLKAGEWIFPLLWNNVAQHYQYDLPQGTVVFEQRGGWSLLNDVTALGDNFKWDYLPMPYFPTPAGPRRTTFGTLDFYGLNSHSKHPQAAWELLKWVAAEDYWQRFTIKTGLAMPSKLSLWDDWEILVTQTAPLLRKKSIQWWKDPNVRGYTVHQTFFRYEPAQAYSMLHDMEMQVLGRKTSVIEGFSGVTRQIDALQATGPAAVAAEAKAARQAAQYAREAASASGAIRVPVPPRYAAGAGAPATPAPKLMKAGPGGSVTLLAQSGGGIAYEVDNCTFACQPFSSSRGVFTCRLAAVSLPRGGSLAAGAKVGLMARETLGDAAPALGVTFSGDRGVHAMDRAQDGWKLNDYRPASDGATTGLIGQSVIQVGNTPAAGGNWLAKPLWLRLVLAGTTWTPYTSLDGVHWAVAGAAWGVQFVGAWVGLCATSHQDGQEIRAVFDHIAGFRPGQVVQVGVL